MDYRKTNAPSNTVTRDMMKLSSDTGNVYETAVSYTHLTLPTNSRV